MDGAETLSGAIFEMVRVQNVYFSEEGIRKARDFTPLPTDVVVSTASKSGTTWVQQICHGLRSHGDMNFEEIGCVFPCLEMAHDSGYEDLQKPQPFEPRMYKTHFFRHRCPKGAGKYIVVVRRPSDAALSLYHFIGDWFFPKEDVSFEEFITHNFLQRGEPGPLERSPSHFQHIMSWYPHRLDKNVLWLHYEDLQQNLVKCVRMIADFLEIGSGDEALLQLVTNQATFEFMKQHVSKFDEHILKQNRNGAAGLPDDAGFRGDVGKVRSGEAYASRSALSEDLRAKFQQKWKEIITAETGYETYESFRDGINKELNRSFF